MKFTKLDNTQIEYIYNTYMVKDFPKSELKPLKLLLKAKENGFYTCFGLFEEKNGVSLEQDCKDNSKENNSESMEMLAYAYVANAACGKAYLLDYLAVNQNIRGRGYGSIMLSKLCEYYRNNTEVSKLIIEAESIRSAKNPEETEIRTKRINFYKRNGLTQQNFMPVVFGTEFTVLTLAVNSEDINIKEEYSSVYHAILDKETYEKNVAID